MSIIRLDPSQPCGLEIRGAAGTADGWPTASRPIPQVANLRHEAFPREGMNPRMDVIVGRPPCQGFSTARQRDGANHGQRRLVSDPRRLLYREFLRYVDFFKPSWS